METERDVTFAAAGTTWRVAFTQRVLRRLEPLGIRTPKDLAEALGAPARMEKVLLEALEGARLKADPARAPYAASDAERILDAVPFETVRLALDRAAVLAWYGPRPPEGTEVPKGTL